MSHHKRSLNPSGAAAAPNQAKVAPKPTARPALAASLNRSARLVGTLHLSGFVWPR